MRARLMKPKDEKALLSMLGEKHGVNLENDIIIVVENDRGELAGCLVARNIFLVHEFRVDAGPLNRHIAEVMFNFAFALGQCHITNPGACPEAAFLIKKPNEAMRKFAESYGAIQEEPADVYCLQLK